MTVTFAVDYRALLTSPARELAFKEAVVSSVAGALKVPNAWVRVDRLRSGSIVADVVILLPAANYSLQEATALTDTVAAAPEVVFQQLKQTFQFTGPVGIEVSTPAHGGGPSSVAIGVGVGLGVGGALCLALAAFVVLRRRRQLVHVQATVRGPTDCAAEVPTLANTAQELHAQAPPAGARHADNSTAGTAKTAWPSLALGGPQETGANEEVRGEAQLS
jgi:hypothetical protein